MSLYKIKFQLLRWFPAYPISFTDKFCEILNEKKKSRRPFCDRGKIIACALCFHSRAGRSLKMECL